MDRKLKITGSFTETEINSGDTRIYIEAYDNVTLKKGWNIMIVTVVRDWNYQTSTYKTTYTYTTGSVPSGINWQKQE